MGEHSTMNEITFEVERDESGWLIASWDAPDGKGGIATQGQDLRELQENVKEAVLCHFEAAAAPRAIRLHFINDPVLVTPLRFLATCPAPRRQGHLNASVSLLPGKLARTFGWPKAASM